MRRGTPALLVGRGKNAACSTLMIRRGKVRWLGVPRQVARCTQREFLVLLINGNGLNFGVIRLVLRKVEGFRALANCAYTKAKETFGVPQLCDCGLSRESDRQSCLRFPPEELGGFGATGDSGTVIHTERRAGEPQSGERGAVNRREKALCRTRAGRERGPRLLCGTGKGGWRVRFGESGLIPDGSASGQVRLGSGFRKMVTTNCR